jgi:predicted ABC-type ATPase
MQWIGLNTLTGTGALASMQDSSQLGVFTFNSMMDGFANQFDAQVGRKLWEWNKDAFPKATKRPTIRFTHIDKEIALSEVSQFLSTLNGILPLGEEDYKAIRVRSGFLPETLPKVDPNKQPQVDAQGNPIPPNGQAENPFMKQGQQADNAATAKEIVKEAFAIKNDEMLLEELRGAYGRPGEVGGSSADPNPAIVKGNQADAAVTGKQDIDKINAIAHDEALDRAKRKQAFDDIATIKAVTNTKYRDGQNMRALLDKAIADGANEIKKKGGHMYLVNPQTKDEWNIMTKVERDYVDYVLNRKEKIYGLSWDDWDLIELRGKYGRKGHVGGSSSEPTYDGETKTHAGRAIPASSELVKIGEISDEDFEALKRGMLFEDEYAKAYLEKHNLTRDEIIAKLSEAREKAKEAKSTKDIHFKDGKYTDERQALHQKIVDDFMKDKPSQENPTVLITGGLPGAGKSSILKTDKFKDFQKDAVYVGADDIKEALAKADGIDTLGVHAGAYHAESRDVAKKLSETAFTQSVNAVLDTTLSRKSETTELMDTMKKNGYQVELIFADLPLEKSVQRATFRFLETERLVDPYNIAMYDAKPKTTFETVKSGADKWSVWNTDVPFGQMPILMDSGGRQ